MKVAIANDLPLAADLLKRVVQLRPENELLWVAQDGAQAVQLCAQNPPDLLLMDLVMPRLDGVEATRQIMARTPCAILVVTFSVDTNVAAVFEAMGAGALDAVDTPTSGSGVEMSGVQTLLNKIDTIRKLLGETTRQVVVPPLPPAIPEHPSRESLVAIGASAGGPSALARLLGSLPASFPAGIVVVQHVDAQFAPGLAEWLGSQTKLPVRTAQAGERPEPGTVLVAGTDDHLVFKNATMLDYINEPLDVAYRPSVDVFFQSVLRHWRGEAVGVLLTGMGRDGAAGLKALREAGSHTIVQDQASCGVYGMPKAAVEIGAATEILPLEKIGPRLHSHFLFQSQPQLPSSLQSV